MYKDQAALEALMAEAGPAFADVPNYYDGQPTALIGEVQSQHLISLNEH
ncbi:MAG: hypothetical protein HOH59_11780 [Rhodospirillaceae bacterium]|jgi:hypothetical protein|nr:hypothetical protein [Rhodospirillaceae bacterium]